MNKTKQNIIKQIKQLKLWKEMMDGNYIQIK